MRKMSGVIMVLAILLLSSCVSKKKYTLLETDLSNVNKDLTNTKGALQKTTLEKEKLEDKFAIIEERVNVYNSKISSLNSTNTSLSKTLSDVNYDKLIFEDNDEVVMSENFKNRMAVTLSKIPAEELVGASTLKDSINLAISYNLKQSIDLTGMDSDDISIKIDKTVVMISVSDKMLFNSGSYKVKSKANKLLEKLAGIINSEPSMDVIIEGHTDSQTINTVVLKDNWDLSVKRATSIVRILQNKYDVDPSRLIASGRSSYLPIADNTNKDGRARNRRTNIVILPNLNKFFALLDSSNTSSLD